MGPGAGWDRGDWALSEGGSVLGGQCLLSAPPPRGGAEPGVRPCCHGSPLAACADVDLLGMPNVCRVWTGPWVTRPGLGRWSRGDAEAPMCLPSRSLLAPPACAPGQAGAGTPGGGGGGSLSQPGFAPTPECHLQKPPLPRRAAPRPGEAPCPPRGRAAFSFVLEVLCSEPRGEVRELGLHLARV